MAAQPTAQAVPVAQAVAVQQQLQSEAAFALMAGEAEKGNTNAMFTKAADLGNLEAIKNIAVIYKDGLGIKADPAKAYTWYLIARRDGYAGEDIARMLGLLEVSLAPAQTQQAQKDADVWIEAYAKQQAGTE